MKGGEPKGEGALASTAWALAGQLATAVFTAAVTLYLVRAFGPRQFGEFALALSVGGIGILLADAAVSYSAARFVADRRDDPERVAAVVAAALRIKLLLALVVAGALALTAGPIAWAYGKPGLEWPLRAMALALAAESIFMLWLAMFGALRRQAVNARLILVESMFEGTAIISAVALGGGVTAALLGRAAGYGIGALGGALVVRRLLGRRTLAIQDASRDTRKEITGYARPLFATNGAYTAFSAVDIQLIGATLSTAAAGLYSAPMRLTVLAGLPGQSLGNSIAPRMARDHADGPDVGVFLTALRFLLVLYIGLIVPMIVWAEPICVTVFGEKFRESADVLRALAPYLLLRGISPVVSASVNFLGQAGRRLPIVLTALVVNVAVAVPLLLTIGPAGAAIGTSVAYAIYVPAHVRIVRQAVELPLRPLVGHVARAVVAAAGMAAVLLAIGTHDLSLLELAAGAVLAPLAFVALLFATGELRLAEARTLAARVRPSRE